MQRSSLSPYVGRLLYGSMNLYVLCIAPLVDRLKDAVSKLVGSFVVKLSPASQAYTHCSPCNSGAELHMIGAHENRLMKTT